MENHHLSTHDSKSSSSSASSSGVAAPAAVVPPPVSQPPAEPDEEKHEEDSCARIQTGNPSDSLTAPTNEREVREEILDFLVAYYGFPSRSVMAQYTSWTADIRDEVKLITAWVSRKRDIGDEGFTAQLAALTAERDKALSLVRTTGAGTIPLDTVRIILERDAAEQQVAALQREQAAHDLAFSSANRVAVDAEAALTQLRKGLRTKVAEWRSQGFDAAQFANELAALLAASDGTK